MKMRTILSAGRRACLLILAVLTLFSVSQVDSYIPIVGLSCCRKSNSRRISGIKECYEQKPREGCHHHAFLIKTSTNKVWCIRPEAAWLRNEMQQGRLTCPPDLTLGSRHRM